MTIGNTFAVIAAGYVSSEDARKDLAALDDLFYSRKVSAYDAVIVVTDAWTQIRVEEHVSRTSSDLTIGPAHHAFTKLFGGPFVAGAVPPLPPDRRLSQSELFLLGEALGPASVVAVAMVLADQAISPEAVFPASEAVAMTSIESRSMELERLAPALADAIHSSIRESTRRARPA